MNLPQGAPALAVIVGAFPVPVELAFFDVIPDHSLFTLLTVDNSIAGEDHPPIFEFACEIEIGPGAVHPRLAPELPFRVIR